MSKYDELTQTEHDKRIESENVEQTMRKVRQLQESYDEHFQRANRFFEEIGFEFRGSDRANVFGALKEEHHRQMLNIKNHLGAQEESLRAANRKLETELDEVVAAKKQALREESQ
ncbi:DUF3958 family protein [Xylocopilactobacillus apicola]|uniref:Uncharacterized protein n=1 Tax=Xylocopilactobacillus apicola TaxID=2932184 RepID=A0AAU9CZB6_9LACO|nr:DUF3958 family protein [Xylocopilactobacillus apicola]BDR59339.1 hypothetical protein XA3_17800 [Xylocopilactobacillus apicola]